MAEGGGGNNSSSSGSNPCPICLGPLNQEAFLDRCFHKFCYNCILHWTKVGAGKHSTPPSSVKCPMCKTINFSMICGYDGNSFQQQYVNQDSGNSFFFSKAHKYRLQCYYIEPGSLNCQFNVSRYWKYGKYCQPNRSLHHWLRREIQALVQEEDVDIIVHHILGVIEAFIRNEQNSSSSTPETKREEFEALACVAARPFLTGRTEQFINELELFLASEMNLEAYDKVYTKHLGWKIPEITEEDEKEEESHSITPSLPYLYFFDDDSDQND